MKVLVLAPQVPWPPRQGTAIRNFHVARQLAERHQVTLLAFGEPATADDPLRAAGARVVSVPPPPARSTRRRLVELLVDPWPDLAQRLRSAAMDDALAAELRALRVDGGPDVVQIEGLEMAPFALRALLRLPAAPSGRPRLVYDGHNAEWLLQRRAWRADLGRPAAWHGALYSLVQTAKLRRFERRLLRACDAVVAVSRADAEAMRVLAPHADIEVVPNGVDTRHYAAADPERSEPDLCVFTGKMDFRPNIDAMVWFARHVWPAVRAARPAARLEIVGRDPTAAVRALEGRGVQVTGTVTDVRTYLERAAVVVAPLRVGGGTRLKVLEAMAAARAVAATSLAVEGLDLRPESELLVADAPDRLAAGVCALLADPVRRAALGRHARARVERDYRWETLVPRIERLYRAEPITGGRGAQLP